MIAVWDDHEFTNDSWKDGAENHQKNEGNFQERKRNALKAYYEWMPIREKGKKEKIKGLPKTYLRGQGGLMGIALHPKFEENNLLYFTMSTPNKDSNGGNTALYSGVLDNNNLKNVKKLLRGQNIPYTAYKERMKKRVKEAEQIGKEQGQGKINKDYLLL